MGKLEEIKSLVENGRAKKVVKLIPEALDEGYSAQDILNNSLLAAMNVVGEQFKNEEIFVPEVLVAARAMNKGLDILKPLLVSDTQETKGIVVLGTVKGDLHDIGKNLVRIMLEGKGITVIDLGTDVDPERFIEEAKNNQADIICCSALLTTTMPEMKRVVELVKENELNVKVMIGGAPVNQEFSDEIGADCYTDDAASCADAAIKLLEGTYVR